MDRASFAVRFSNSSKYIPLLPNTLSALFFLENTVSPKCNYDFSSQNIENGKSYNFLYKKCQLLKCLHG